MRPFPQRYILQKNKVDMCGVIKNVEPGGRTLYTGVVSLDAGGQATVPLPTWFTPARHKHDSFSYQVREWGP